MKYLLSVGIVAYLFIFSLGVFWRVHGLEARELGVLTGGVDTLAAGWQANGVPAVGQALNIILSDAESETDPLVAPAELGSLDRAFVWFNRSIIGGNPRTRWPTTFVKIFSEGPNTVAWTHAGFTTVSEEAMTREVMKAVVKAGSLGAEVNIVAQGVSAGPVLAGLMRLEGAKRGGVKVGVNKVLIVGVDPPRLKWIPAISSYDFTQPGNVMELAHIWSAGGGSGSVRVRVYGARLKGTEYEASDLWPVLNASDSTLGRFLAIIRELAMNAEGFEKSIGRLADAAEQREKSAWSVAQAAAAEKTVTVKSHDGRYSRKTVAYSKPASAPQSSLSFIKMDGQGEGVRPGGGDERTPSQARSSVSAGQKGGGCGDYMNVRCCVGPTSRERAAKAYGECRPLRQRWDLWTECNHYEREDWKAACRAACDDFRACVEKQGCTSLSPR